MNESYSFAIVVGPQELGVMKAQNLKNNKIFGSDSLNNVLNAKLILHSHHFNTV